MPGAGFWFAGTALTCGAGGFYFWDGDYVITFRASNLFACVAFGDGGFVATVIAVKPNKRIRLNHFRTFFIKFRNQNK
jgi:hypothetical protein